MRRISFFICAILFASISATAQFTYKIKADSLLVTNDSCTAEFNLENSTKHIKGFLYNTGRGRTKFVNGLLKVNDSLYMLGPDSLKLPAAGTPNAWSLNGNALEGTSSFLGTTDPTKLVIKTNNVNRAVFNQFGDVGIGTMTRAGA